LKTSEQQLATLTETAGGLGQPAIAELDRVRSMLAGVRHEALDDPLEVQADLARELQQPLQALTEKLAAIKGERADVREALIRAQARQTRASRNAVLESAQVADLGEWLAGIARTLESGEYAAARIGLQRWTAAADTVYTTEEQREEQLGLLKALRVMAERRRLKGAAVDPGLDALALEAESALRHRPPDLARAKQLVERYQQGLTAAP
jgi:hypothetical protein